MANLSRNLRKHRPFLLNELDPSLYIDSLYAADVLCDEERDELAILKSTRRKQASYFVDVMTRKPPNSIRTFLDILRDEKDKQPHIWDKLCGESAKRTLTATKKPISSPKRRKRCQDDDDDAVAEVTSDHLDVVADLARDKWQSIGRYLRYSAAELEEFREKQPRELRHRLLDLLEDWHRRKGDEATVDILFRACEKAGCGGQMKKAFKKLDSSSE